MEKCQVIIKFRARFGEDVFISISLISNTFIRFQTSRDSKAMQTPELCAPTSSIVPMESLVFHNEPSNMFAL